MNNQDLKGLYESYRNVYVAVEDSENEVNESEKTSYQPDFYDLVLEYLLNEGFCETEDNARIMMIHMSEAWIDDILDEALVDNGKPEHEKEKMRKERGNGNRTQHLLRQGRKTRKSNGHKYEGGKYLEMQREKYYESYMNVYENSEAVEENNIEEDTYDLVLEYLLNGGFADSEKTAQVIVSNMSEAWLNDIIEAFVPLSKEKEARVTDAIKKNMQARAKDDISTRKDVDRLKKIPKPLRRFSRTNKRLLDKLDKYRKTPKGLNKNELLQNAQDSLTHTHAHRSAETIHKRNELKRKIRDLKGS
jgi:hypothetical protein